MNTALQLLTNTKLFKNQERFTCHMITSNLLSEILLAMLTVNIFLCS